MRIENPPPDPRLPQRHSNAWSVAACDHSGNGTPDLLAASYGRAPNHLWAGESQDNTAGYENLSVPSGYAFDHRIDRTDNESARSNSGTTVCADLDNDGRLDLSTTEIVHGDVGPLSEPLRNPL